MSHFGLSTGPAAKVEKVAFLEEKDAAGNAKKTYTLKVAGQQVKQRGFLTEL